MNKTQGKRTSIFDNILIWLGAGVSIAEILTGTYFADLGFGKGLTAIIIGHIIGCIMLFLAGLMGARTGKSSMETVKDSFGNKGGLIFAFLNILQLLGWTAIMIYDGAMASSSIFKSPGWVWSLVIGFLIILWILIGITNLGKINTVAMAALFILTVILSIIIFRSGNISPVISGSSLTFGAAVELSVAMPLSWLPLISDYTREAAKPVSATFFSTLTYGVVSCWMYVVGMGAAILTGQSDIAGILLKAGLGIAGLVIIIFSTVTTTFLDAWSAGISSESILPQSKPDTAVCSNASISNEYASNESVSNESVSNESVSNESTLAENRKNTADCITDDQKAEGPSKTKRLLSGKLTGRHIAIATAALGTIGAIFFPMDDITGFLYLIGSVFAPMIAIQIADSFVLKKTPFTGEFEIRNLIIWVLGFILYRILMSIDIPVGNTLPDMAGTILICIIVEFLKKARLPIDSPNDIPDIPDKNDTFF